MATPGSVIVGLDFQDRNNTLNREIRRGLGQAAGDLRNFDQQLDRANRRVLAFGTSAAIVYGTVRAFRELVTATVQVEKSLTSINTIFQLNGRELDGFSKKLFNVARETGQSFANVAKAAEEFSRQGLNAAETAKRTRDAMILVRLTGVDTAKAVNGLTAAMSTFGKTGVDTTQIINKLVAADQSFAVSAGGLIDAFTRVGSTVDDAGVSLESFIGLVTAARQITSRSEAVIGNSLKTIFTRLERSGTILDQLEEMGVAVRNVEGNIRPVLQVFQELANSYKDLGRAQQQQVAELGAGVFQINQFKALLLDLGKANGIYEQATSSATNASTEALVRNKIANQTLDASIEALKNSATQAGAIIGQLSLKPAIEDMLTLGGLLASPFQGISAEGDTKWGENFGAAFGESALKGIGKVLGGPGLVAILKLVSGALYKTVPEIGRDLKSTASFVGNQQVQSLTAINTLLKQGTAEENARFMAAKRLAEQEEIILGILQRQAVLMGRGIVAPASKLARASVPRAAEGFVPAMSAERAAIHAGVGGAPSTARAVYLPNFNRGSGQKGIVANSSEYIVPNMAAGGGSAIFNRDMVRKHGLPPGSTPIAAGGFIPNAADGVPSKDNSEYKAYLEGNIIQSAKVQEEISRALAMQRAREAERKAKDIDKAYVLLAKEKMLADAKSKLTSTQIETAEKTLTATQSLYQQARLRGEKLGLTREASVLPSTYYMNRAISSFGPVVQSGPNIPWSARNIYRNGVNAMGQRSSTNIPTPFDDPANSQMGLEDENYVSKKKNDALRAQRKAQKDASDARVNFFERSDARQRSIAFDRITGRVAEGRDISPAQQRLVQQVFREKAREVASKVFAPGTSDAAIRGFVTAYADAQIERLNEAGNKALQQRMLVAKEFKQAKFARRMGNMQMGLLGASFGAGFIPEGQGGTRSGMALGATHGLAQGAATGGFMGQTFGPMGALVGAVAGGLGGAITGWVSKLTKSFEEISAEIDDANSALRREMDSVSQSFDLQDKIAEAIAGGAPQEQVVALQSQYNQTLRGVKDPKIQSMIMGYNGDTDVKQVAMEQYAQRARHKAIQDNIRLSFSKTQGGFGLWGTGAKAGEEARDSLGSAFSGLSNESLANIAKEMRDRKTALKVGTELGAGSQLGSLGATMKESWIGKLAMLSSPFLGGITKQAEERTADTGFDATIGAINQEMEIRRLREAEKARRAALAIQEAGPRPVLKTEAARLMMGTSLAGSLQQLGIESGGRVRQSEQDMLLSDPSLGPMMKLSMERDFSRENITRSFEGIRTGAIATQKTNMLGMLDQNDVRQRATYEAVQGVNDIGGAMALAKRLKDDPQGFKTGMASSEISEALDKMIAEMTLLNATESAALIEADKGNEYAKQTLMRSYSVQNRTDAMRVAVNEDRGQRKINAQATLNLAAEGNPGITGGMVEGSMMDLATMMGNSGAKGGAVGSFKTGAGSVFARMRQDMMQFAEVGARVAQSLEQNLGNAFGDFITGAAKGKDAFRTFVHSVMADAARAMASKAIQQTLGMIFSGFGAPSGGISAAAMAIPTANGGPIALASGGTVPVMAMGGEFIFNPAQASRLGPKRLASLNAGVMPMNAGGPAGKIVGGSGFKDDVFMRLAQGSYVIKKSSVERLGADNLSALASQTATLSMADGGGAMTSTIAPSSTATPIALSRGGGGGAMNVGVNVTVNDNRSTSKTDTQGGTGDQKSFGEELGRAVDQAVMKTLEKQQRIGGIMYKPNR